MQQTFLLLLGGYLGVTLRYARLTEPRTVRQALSLRGGDALRTVLAALGWSMGVVSLLSWLAVIDVELLTVAPLNGAVLLGSVIFGLSAALGGYTPWTALAAVGGGSLPEALCACAGCAAGLWCLPRVEPWLTGLRALLPATAQTLFRVTLDEPYLWQGGFLGQGFLGAVLLMLALYVPSARTAVDGAAEADAPETGAAAEGDASSGGEDPTEADASLGEEEPAVPAASPVIVRRRLHPTGASSAMPRETAVYVRRGRDGMALRRRSPEISSMEAGANRPQ